MGPSRQDQFDALTLAISRVVTPVVLCMALSVWFVNSLGNPEDCDAVTDNLTPQEISADPNQYIVTTGEPNVTFNQTGSIIFVAVFLVFMVVFTFLLVWLYRKGYTKIIFGWLVLAVFLIFGYVGGVYIFEFCRSRCIDLDWITLAFAVWNFTVTGLISVFWTVPRFINQSYLIVMSALMAYIFRTLPEWGTWTILSVLVVWDLFAVLTPCGPLRKLVESARERGDPIPALVYDTNPNDVGRDASAQPSVVIPRKNKARDSNDGNEETTSTPINADRNGTTDSGSSSRRREASKTGTDEQGTSNSNRTEGSKEPEGETEIAVGTMGVHLKLGLGDFVFYSVLVAQASRGGSMTAITSFVAILAGLCATLFLVTVYRKALPALPISITAGIIFYVLTKYTVEPLVEKLLPELVFH